MSDFFIKLFIAQAKNQSPDNPVDSNNLVGQMAQIAQVEATQKMSEMMKNQVVQGIGELRALSSARLIGQQVTVEVNHKTEIELKTKQLLAGRLTLAQAATNVTLYLTDAAGKQHPINLGDHAAGPVNFSIDPNKQKPALKPGKYTLRVETSSEEKSIPLEIAGTVNNVRISPEGKPTTITVSGVGEVAYYRVRQFSAPQDDKTPHTTYYQA